MQVALPVAIVLVDGATRVVVILHHLWSLHTLVERGSIVALALPFGFSAAFCRPPRGDERLEMMIVPPNCKLVGAFGTSEKYNFFLSGCLLSFA
jgi:hypothetical protein